MTTDKVTKLTPELTNSVEIKSKPIINQMLITDPVGDIKSGLLSGALRATKSGKIITTEADWTPYDNNFFERIDLNVLQAKNVDIEANFQIGDKVRLYQGAFKHFYIIKVDASTKKIYLDGGSDYELTSAEFRDVSISRFVSPSGFPTVFNFDSAMSTSGGSDVVVTSESSVYTMSGRLITVSYDIDLTYTTTPSSSTVLLPFAVGDIVLRIWGTPVSTTDGGATGISFIDPNTDYIVITGTFGSTGTNLGLTMTYPYRPA